MKRENNIILPRRRILPWNWESNRTRTELEPTLWQNRTELELTCRKICRTQTFLFSCSTCDRRTFNVWLVAWHSWFLPTVQRNQPNVKRPSVARRTWTCCVCVSVVKCRRSLTGEHPCTLVGGLSPNIGVGGAKKRKIGVSFIRWSKRQIYFIFSHVWRATDGRLTWRTGCPPNFPRSGPEVDKSCGFFEVWYSIAKYPCSRRGF